ncbi:37f01ce7-e425-433a-927d-df9003954b97 [Thermothielavioides terrestris]|uniref:Uncharacterized protein n=2 Tax=Thermothielavioides terrestris TaxID=2587410 RepID=G2QVD2_THETT|nr:uncharacterized protein THITE_123337 [Thermothielavioides terrestris NRRL 8126]AEO63819.1 hypothetical protein THITE_123337 [Thermothielavioides terrestris NRRL 8126]SPQ23455.1 37f01ce7-e425-433a-927d-df9003954b97 [Thermothielavioides terrestris]
MSLAVSQCVYNQIQSYSLTDRRPRPWGGQLLVFAVTRLFDVALATAAATAAAAAGAHAAGAPLTSEILRNAAVGGALKSGAMVLAGLFLLAPQNTPFLVLPMLLGTSIATNVLLVAAMANRTIGYAPTQLLVAAVVASVPLGFCPVYYYGAFRVPITFTSIPFDVLGAYTFAKMADNLGYPICPARPALVAGAVFGTVFSTGLTLFSCCVIGRRRTIFLRGSSQSGMAYASCCGNRVYINASGTELYGGPGMYGSLDTYTTGTVLNSAHAIGIYWNPGALQGHLVWQTSSSIDNTATRSGGQATMFRML